MILLGVIKRKRLTNSTEVSPLTIRKLRYATGLLPHPPKHERRHAVSQRHCHFHLHQRRNRQQQHCEFFGTIFQLNNKPLFYSYSGFVLVLLGKLLARNTYCLQTLFYTYDTSRNNPRQPTRKDLHQLCAHTGYNLKDLIEAMDDRDRERVNESVLSVQLDKDDIKRCKIFSIHWQCITYISA